MDIDIELLKRIVNILFVISNLIFWSMVLLEIRKIIFNRPPDEDGAS